MIGADNILNNNGNYLKISDYISHQNQVWQGILDFVSFNEKGIKSKLLNLEKPCYIIRVEGKVGATNEGYLYPCNQEKTGQAEILISTPPLSTRQLGDPNFINFHGVKYAYATGAMAQGIASEELVIALGKEKILSSFGAGGLSPARVEAAIQLIQQALTQGPYAFNLLHSPSEPAIERGVVDLYLKYQVRTIEASAFLDLTDNIVYYRAAGLGLNADNQIEIKNKIIAKVSRREVAIKFLQPSSNKNFEAIS